MPRFNTHAIRRFINRRGQPVTVRNTAITHDPNTDWDDEVYTVEDEIETLAIVMRPGTQPEAIRDLEGVEISADYVVYIKDDVGIPIYDDSDPTHSATEVNLGDITYIVVAAPSVQTNGAYKLPVERVQP